MRAFVASLMLLGLGTAHCVVAADDPPPAPTQTSSTAAPKVSVSGIKTVTTQKKCPAARCASLGDEVVISVSGDLGAYLDHVQGLPKQVTLFLDGVDTGIAAEAKDRDGGTLRFRLERNPNHAENKRIWSALLRDPFSNHYREVVASIGVAGGVAEPAKGSTFTLSVIKWEWYAWLWASVIIAVVFAFGWLVIERDMLRDAPRPAPYSLGRCQMAWWFLLILFGYVFIWLISGDRDAITESLLVLMGISAGTGLSAVMINANTSGAAALTQAASDRLALQAAQQNTSAKVASASAAVAAAPADAAAQKQLADAQAELGVVNAKLAEANNLLNGVVVAPQTRGWLRDVMSDSAGNIGLHRFQIVVWTVVLGIIFASSVLIDLSMPTFSPTLLTLMGISAGTYLGFKFPEK